MIKHNLKRNIGKWREIGTNPFILKVIESGYEIPFVSNPPTMCFRNNKSAIHNVEFVSSEISDLLKYKRIIEVPFQPFVCSPLSVAENKNKKRLILDLSRLNKYVKYEKIKFEDWKTALDYFEKGFYCIKFDLKSGYHHIDIAEEYQNYLGFQWDNKYYCFTVLPFGLSSAPFIFTKCLRPLVKFLRKSGIMIVLYLDDGLAFASTESQCILDSNFIQKTLSETGLVVNIDKSKFIPTQIIEWLGLTWNSNSFSISVPDRRIEDAVCCLKKVIGRFPDITARELAQVVGKIISMTPVMGNMCNIMTRFSSMEIAVKELWDSKLLFKHRDQVFEELNFWIKCIPCKNTRFLHSVKRKNVIIYSDASNSASSAYTVEVNSKVFHLMWKDDEKNMSSTWRELKAIELALASFKNELQETTVKWFTDNQSCEKIVHSGSMKHHLQVIAYNIFKMCADSKISLDVQWIPRSENDKADFLSKIIDHDDWEVTVEFFDFVSLMFGPFTVDRFANFNNRKLLRYNSKFWNPESEAVDCFTKNWEGENNWLVPPIHLIVSSIKHLLNCKAYGVLVVPNWPSAVLWPMLFDENLYYKTYVKDVLLFKDTREIIIQGQNKNCLFGSIFFGSGILVVRLDATNL